MTKLMPSDVKKLERYTSMSNRERDLCRLPGTGFFSSAWNSRGLKLCCDQVDRGEEPEFQIAKTPDEI